MCDICFSLTVKPLGGNPISGVHPKFWGIGTCQLVGSERLCAEHSCNTHRAAGVFFPPNSCFWRFLIFLGVFGYLMENYWTSTCLVSWDILFASWLPGVPTAGSKTSFNGSLRQLEETMGLRSPSWNWDMSMSLHALISDWWFFID